MDPLQVLELAVAGLEKLEISYMIAGSFASTIYGEPRYTQDADLIVSLELTSVNGLIRTFVPEFYVERGQVEYAVRHRRSFNLIHIESAFKVDLFVVRGGAYERESFRRRTRRLLDAETNFTPYVQTPEDNILSKLDWYRQGGQVSEQQWRDVLGILRVQEGALDVDYLRKWAKELQLSDLLEGALGESARGSGA